MKFNVRVILVVTLLTGLIGYIVWQLKAKDDYEELAYFENFPAKATIKAATNTELSRVHELLNKGKELYNKNVNEALDLSGFPRTLEGLIKFWNHEAPPYSFFNHQQNEKEILIASLRNLSLETGEWLQGDQMLFRMLEKGNGVTVYKESSDGITTLTYVKSK